MLQNSLNMRFVVFKTPTPKRFKYTPRYFDEDKERLEKRKAELGLSSELTHQEKIRSQMRKKWKSHDKEFETGNLRKFFYFAF